MQKTRFTWFLYWKLLIDTDFINLICHFHQFCKCQRVISPSCTSTRHAGRFDYLMTSLIPITTDSDKPHCVWWQSGKFPNQTQGGELENWNMYATKQIKVCAEYRVMLSRPRLVLSGTSCLQLILIFISKVCTTRSSTSKFDEVTCNACP